VNAVYYYQVINPRQGYLLEETPAGFKVSDKIYPIVYSTVLDRSVKFELQDGTVVISEKTRESHDNLLKKSIERREGITKVPKAASQIAPSAGSLAKVQTAIPSRQRSELLLKEITRRPRSTESSSKRQRVAVDVNSVCGTAQGSPLPSDSDKDKVHISLSSSPEEEEQHHSVVEQEEPSPEDEADRLSQSAEESQQNRLVSKFVVNESVAFGKPLPYSTLQLSIPRPATDTLSATVDG
jgi:hypothetical protein